MITKQKFFIGAAMFALIGVAQNAEAGILGCGSKCQARRAAEQQELQRRYDDQRRYEDAQRQQQYDVQRQYEIQRQQQYEAQRQYEAQQAAARAYEQQQWEAQQRAAAQAAANRWQVQPPPPPQPAANQWQPQVLPQATQPGVGLGQVDENGVPLFGPDGLPISDKDKALWPFRHQAIQDMPFVVSKTEWSDADEDQFSQFVAQFGAGIKAKPMRLLNFYMHDPSINPYASRDPQGVYYYSDCADLPIFLRAYFAYQNGLPMSVSADAVMNMQPFASESNPNSDLWSQTHTDRTDVSPYGNSLSRRAAANIPNAANNEQNFIKYWGKLMDTASTRTFMVSPWTPNYGQLADIYPVKINRQGIRPGTLVHSDGHMLLVSAVTANGDVELIDAHPDNSLQFKTLDPSKLNRDRPDRAYGFFRFRPMYVEGGQRYNARNGQVGIYGAKIRTASDQELANKGLWSVEQWMGPGFVTTPGAPVDRSQWKRAFEDKLEFFFFVRGQLAQRQETSDNAAKDLLEGLCTDVKQRVADVAAAGNLPLKPRPDTLPKNIYNAEPVWEQLATPSRDARVRQAILNIPDLLSRYFRYGVRNKYALSFQGSAADYQQRVGQIWQQLDATCKVTYKNSLGQPVAINFSQIVERAPRMSFDYADCVEKRWGAPDQEIAATCRDTDPQGRWYRAEQTMRNAGGKTNENGKLVIRSDRPITIEMLESRQYLNQPDSAEINLGLPQSKQPNLKAYLASPQFLQDLSR